MARMTKAERKAINDQLDEAWKKERKRIMDRGRALKKRGYTLDADFVPPKQMPRHDKRILNRIKKFKGDEVYKKVSFSAKGKTVHGKRARKYEKEVRAQNETVPTVDVFDNLKRDLGNLFSNLTEEISQYDWHIKQAELNKNHQHTDVMAKIQELEETIAEKFISLEADEKGLEYKNYLENNIEKINSAIQTAYAHSNGTEVLKAIDEAIHLITQNDIRSFDSGDVDDYGVGAMTNEEL